MRAYRGVAVARVIKRRGVNYCTPVSPVAAMPRVRSVVERVERQRIFECERGGTRTRRRAIIQVRRHGRAHCARMRHDGTMIFCVAPPPARAHARALVHRVQMCI